MAVEMFKNLADSQGLDIKVIHSEDQTTHTAADAAKAHGVPVSNIVKSLLCEVSGDAGERHVLILVPGDRRLDFDEWTELLKANKLKMASPADVKDITGYSIGGVPPFGHIAKIETYIDEGFDISEELLAAAGSNQSIFKCTIEQLIKWTYASDIKGIYE